MVDSVQMPATGFCTNWSGASFDEGGEGLSALPERRYCRVGERRGSGQSACVSKRSSPHAHCVTFGIDPICVSIPFR